MIKTMLILLLICSGCAGTWQERSTATLGALAAATTTVDNTAMSIFDLRCLEFANDCGQARATQCPRLEECQASRREVTKVILTVYRALRVATTAIAAGEEKDAVTMIAKIREAIRSLYLIVDSIAPNVLPPIQDSEGIIDSLPE
jgi:hypothetical protein